MRLNAFVVLPVVTALLIATAATVVADPAGADEKLPTVLVTTLFRNKAHVLPYFFSFLHALDYPKDRIALW